MPWSGELVTAPTSRKSPSAEISTVKSRVLTPREQFLQFATTPRFPRHVFGPHERLQPATLGLRVEPREGRQVVTTPVGLGLTEAQAKSWLAPLSEATLTNFPLFELSFRAALVPREMGGPGLTFTEAQQAAFKAAFLSSPSPAALEAAHEAFSEAGAAKAFCLEPYGSSGSSPVPIYDCWWGWPWYEYPSTANPPASFSEQMSRRDSQYLLPDLKDFKLPAGAMGSPIPNSRH
jgi:hypothetical protein